VLLPCHPVFESLLEYFSTGVYNSESNKISSETDSHVAFSLTYKEPGCSIDSGVDILWR